MSTFTLTRGADNDMPLVAGVDLSGCTVTFQARYHRWDAAADSVFSKTTEDDSIEVTDAVGGLATVHIDAADWDAYITSGVLIWEVTVTGADDEVMKTPDLIGTILVNEGLDP